MAKSFGNPKGKKSDGMMTEIPLSARKRLREHQEAIRATKKGVWRPAPSLHEFGDTFYSHFIGMRHREVENRKSKQLVNTYTPVFTYVADGEDAHAAKYDGKEWPGRAYRDTIYRDPDTHEERVIDFGTLKQYASMVSGEEVEDGEDALNILIAAAREKPLVQVRLRQRPNNQGGEPYIEEDILAFTSGGTAPTETDAETDEAAEGGDDGDAEGEDAADADEDTEEEAAPPSPPPSAKRPSLRR